MDAAGTISELRLEIVELKAQLVVEGISEAREIAIRNQITALQNQINILMPQSPGNTHVSSIFYSITSIFCYICYVSSRNNMLLPIGVGVEVSDNIVFN
jgi:hypothetical protein